jgi:hypothetical protein
LLFSVPNRPVFSMAGDHDQERRRANSDSRTATWFHKPAHGICVHRQLLHSHNQQVLTKPTEPNSRSSRVPVREISKSATTVAFMEFCKSFCQTVHESIHVVRVGVCIGIPVVLKNCSCNCFNLVGEFVTAPVGRLKVLR